VKFPDIKAGLQRVLVLQASENGTYVGCWMLIIAFTFCVLCDDNSLVNNKSV